MLYFIYIIHQDHFLFLLKPRFTITLLPPEDEVFPKLSVPLEEVNKNFPPFYLADSVLNKFKFVLPISSILAGFSTPTESNEVPLIEFLEGRFILRLELGRTLISGKKLYPDFIMLSVGEGL